MKIGVVGVGALGAYYGGWLHRAGAEVHLLLRSDYDTVRSNGIRIDSGEETVTVEPHCHQRPETIGECDLVLVGLKSTANDRYLLWEIFKVERFVRCNDVFFTLHVWYYRPAASRNKDILRGHLLFANRYCVRIK